MNNEQGQCVQCLKSLGSYPKALIAGLLAAVALSILWVGAAFLMNIQLAFFALFYGAVISGAITYFSGGRGLSFQFIASVLTVGGMLLADTAVVFLLWEQLPGVEPGSPRPEFSELMVSLVEYEGSTLLFMIFGWVGGLFIWRG